MTKITLTDLANLQNETTAVNAINNNNAVIETAFDNTLSRDGTSPNTMGAALDMNNHHILNLPAPVGATDPVRLQDITGTTTVNAIPPGGTTGQGLRKTSNADYVVGWGDSGTVSSVGLALPTDFTITNSPVTNTGTLTGAWATVPNGTGAMVRTTSPALVTPSLGVATATSVNKVAITAPTNSATLTIPDNVTLTGPATSGTVMTLGNAETVTGAKSFNDSTVILKGSTSGTTTLKSGATAGSSVITLPVATDTLVGKATTDGLTNKTFDTAGTGNSFLINGVAVTANQGTGSVVRATSPTLTTPVLGVATATSLAFSPTTGGIIGTNTNNSVSAGTVGEFVSSTVTSGSAVALTTNTGANVTSISLTAGDWLVTGQGVFAPAATTTQTFVSFGISTTSATIDFTGSQWAQFPSASFRFRIGRNCPCLSLLPEYL
jgi:hypothetical protein